MKEDWSPLELIVMLDMSMFREKSEILRKDHDKRKIPHDNIDEVIRLDNEWKQARYEVDQLRKTRNESAGGGSAGVIQVATVAIRGLSSTITLGFGNSFVASGENIASVILTFAALIAPLLAAIFAIFIVVLLVRQSIKITGDKSVQGD